MLLGFGGRNFYSFREDFDISLVNKDEVLHVLGIKGANASGKTNVIRALSYIKMFMFSSFSELKPEDGMLYKPFFDSNDSTELYIHFKINNMEYKYEIEFTKDYLIKEVLYRKKTRWKKILVREEQKITKAIKEFNDIKSIKINRKNASVISISHQYGINDLEDFYNFAENIVSNVSFSGKRTNDEYYIGIEDASKIYYRDKKLLKIVENFLKAADTGIDKIEIEKIDNKTTKKTTYLPIFYHKTEKGIYKVQYFDESNGTQLLYRQLGAYFTALANGTVVAHDEFDIGLHPDLSLMIINLFDDKRINSKGAQLIFTSHYSEIMDKLGKYRLIFVNKENNESYLYRLDEIPGEIIRPDRSLMPAYNSHKIGGRPRVAIYG